MCDNAVGGHRLMSLPPAAFVWERAHPGTQMKKTLIVALGFIAASIANAEAQTYPSKPITMIAPFAAGGPTDTVARILAERMRGPLGQSIIVENIVGAGGSIGVGRVARASPDGYTIVVGNWGTFVVIGAIYALQYDLVKDFDPILPLVTEPTVVVAKKAHPATNLRELVAWLKANLGKGTMGTSGLGGPSHIFGVLFRKVTEADVQLVPYRGAGPAVQDLAAGQIDMMITGPTIVLPLARAGTIKTFAVNNKNSLGLRARDSDRGRGGIAGSLFFGLARTLGAQGHAKGHHRQAQCRRFGGAGRRVGEKALRRHRPRHLAARRPDADGARRASKGRNRALVASHQSRWHQSAVILVHNAQCRLLAHRVGSLHGNELGRNWRYSGHAANSCGRRSDANDPLRKSGCQSCCDAQ